ncbi:hypothetical protein RhiirB3_458782, partial [Rhizophagus irregularis]
PIESGTDEIIDSFSDCYLSDEEPDQENEPPAEEPALEADDDYDVLDDLLSDSDPITTNPAHEQQPESPTFVTKSDPEPVPKEQSIPEPATEPEIDWDPKPKEGTQAHWTWQERRRWDRKPWVKNSKDQIFRDLYNTGKDLWIKYQDASDEDDWNMLAFEVEECPTTHVENKYQYYFREVVNRFKDWIKYNGDLPKMDQKDKGKAREIPEEHPKTDMERQWEGANGTQFINTSNGLFRDCPCFTYKIRYQRTTVFRCKIF